MAYAYVRSHTFSLLTNLNGPFSVPITGNNIVLGLIVVGSLELIIYGLRFGLGSFITGSVMLH